MTNLTQRWFILGALRAPAFFYLLCVCVLPLHAVDESESAASVAWRAAVTAAGNHDFSLAVRKSDEAERLGLTQPEIYYHRGRWNFRAGNVEASLKDFDRYVKLRPQRANSQWERGITCYYANQYKAGAKQFEDYQKFHDNDVENAVWRYLCQMKFDGKETARKAILPIKHDPRVPMMEIYRLFRGESTPENVLKVLADADAESNERLAKQQRFDAHLYLALFYESEGDLDSATKNIDAAVKQFTTGDYMWAVAVEHQKHLRKRLAAAEQATP